MLDIKLVSVFQRACAFMPKRMRCLKQVESGSEKILFSTVTRRSLGKSIDLHKITLCI